MPATSKVNLTRTQFEFFCKSIFRRFILLLDEEDRALYPNLPDTENKESFDNFINTNYSHFISEMPNTAKGQLTPTAIAFVDQVYTNRKNAEIGENLGYIISESNTNKQEYSKIFTSFLKRKYERDYKPKKKKKITFGGTKRAIDKYKSRILFWYLGFGTIDEFIEVCPVDSEINDDLILHYQSQSFLRKDEWDRFPKEFIEGTWRLEATENESQEDPFSKNIFQDKSDQFRYVHKRNIEYDVRFSYWSDMEFKFYKQEGFFSAEGVIHTNTMILELDEWKMKAIGSFRSSRGTQYICIDFEMFPKEGIDSPRTFGYCIARPFFKEKIPIMEGFYISNRMRDPFDYADKDNKFMNGLRISMGRMVLFKK